VSWRFWRSSAVSPESGSSPSWPGTIMREG
jgi:hypothetical protein